MWNPPDPGREIIEPDSDPFDGDAATIDRAYIGYSRRDELNAHDLANQEEIPF